MKTFIYLFLMTSLFCCSKTSFSQNETIKEADTECKKGIDSAKVNIQNQHYEYKVYGTRISNYHTFSKLVREKYSIKVSYDVGCLVFEKEECYSDYMNKKTREKYGKFEIEEIWNEANYIDSVGLGNRRAFFEAGNEKMYNLIYSNLDFTKIYEEEKKHRIFVQIHIDTTGKAKVDSVVRTNSIETRQEIKRAIELLPKWIIATRDGKAIAQKFNLTLLFSEEIRKKYNK